MIQGLSTAICEGPNKGLQEREKSQTLNMNGKDSETEEHIKLWLF